MTKERKLSSVVFLKTIAKKNDRSILMLNCRYSVHPSQQPRVRLEENLKTFNIGLKTPKKQKPGRTCKKKSSSVDNTARTMGCGWPFNTEAGEIIC